MPLDAASSSLPDGSSPSGAWADAAAGLLRPATPHRPPLPSTARPARRNSRSPYPAGQAPHNPYRVRSLAVSVSMAPERAPSPTRHAPRPGVPDRAAAKPPWSPGGSAWPPPARRLPSQCVINFSGPERSDRRLGDCQADQPASAAGHAENLFGGRTVRCPSRTDRYSHRSGDGVLAAVPPDV